MSHLIAFDLDGTLIDSRQDLAESANEMLAGYGAGPLAVSDVTGMVGDGARELVIRALDMAGIEVDIPAALDRFLAIYAERLIVHTRPYDGILAAVEAASRQASLAVLTNKPEALSRRLLVAFDLAPLFRWVIGGDSPFPRKPDPAGLRHLMSEAGTAGETTMLVGDSMVDVETARRADAKACVALYGFGQARTPIVLAGGELVARTPADLPGIFGDFTRQVRASNR